MDEIEQVKATLEEAKATNDKILKKLDAVLARLGQLSGGATPAEVAEVLALGKEVQEGTQSTEDKIDSVTPLPEEPAS